MGIAAFVTGAGEPVTVVAHGLGASVAETRPLAGGVAGTRVFFTAPGHGSDVLPDIAVTYAALATDLAEVADSYGATQAIGVSMGAGALLRLLSVRPDRFGKVVLFLPAALDETRTGPGVRRLRALGQAIRAGDRPLVHALVLAELPADLLAEPTVAAYALARTERLLGLPGIADVIEALTPDVPVADRGLLGSVTAQVLVLGQEGDELHPAQVARDVVAALPRARLELFDAPGVAFREPGRLRGIVGSFLSQVSQ